MGEGGGKGLLLKLLEPQGGGGGGGCSRYMIYEEICYGFVCGLVIVVGDPKY